MSRLSERAGITVRPRGSMTAEPAMPTQIDHYVQGTAARIPRPPCADCFAVTAARD